MKASEYRRLVAAREATAKVKLPSGAIFTLRRLPLEPWIADGKIPQYFLRLNLRQQGNADPAGEISDEAAVEGMAFVARAIRYACVEPRLVERATSEEEMEVAELSPEDFGFLTE